MLVVANCQRARSLVILPTIPVIGLAWRSRVPPNGGFHEADGLQRAENGADHNNGSGRAISGDQGCCAARSETRIEKAARKRPPEASSRRPIPLTRALAGAVIGSKQMNSEAGGANTCAHG